MKVLSHIIARLFICQNVYLGISVKPIAKVWDQQVTGKFNMMHTNDSSLNHIKKLIKFILDGSMMDVVSVLDQHASITVLMKVVVHFVLSQKMMMNLSKKMS